MDAICTILDSNSVKEFISSLNNYGECIDYCNDYERSKERKGIFVGIVNKVYDVIPKGNGGHVELDTLFISAKSLINSKRESQPFRIGFTGKIVHQLLDANLKQGDAIGILKPMFFYALDIPSLNAGTKNIIVWIGKQLKDSQITVDTASSSEKQNDNCLNKQRNRIENVRNRIIREEHSNSQSFDGISTVSYSTLQRDVQIYRSRPVELNKISSKVSSNNKLIPDSTTKSFIRNKTSEGVEFVENVISQNTANDGSIEISVGHKNATNRFSTKCDPHLRHTQGASHDHCANNTCYNSNSHVVSCEHKCPCLNVNCCDCQKVPRNHRLENYSCDSKTLCECFHKQCCLCNRSSCCGHNTISHCRCWNSSHSCHGGSCSANRYFEHSCRLCCRAPYSKASGACCSNDILHCSSDCRSKCAKLKKCSRSNHLDKKSCITSKHSCHERITKHQCSNCFCNSQRQTKDADHRILHCCGLETKSNEHLHFSNLVDNNKETNSVSSEVFHINRTKAWVHNWTQDPPCLQLQSEKSESEISDISFRNPSSCVNPGQNTIELNKKGDNETNQESAQSIIPSLPHSSNSCAGKKSNEHIKKKKLFSPLDNSTIISERSLYNNSTIVEESTPFSSENHTDNTPVLPSEKHLGFSNLNSLNHSIELPLSKQIIDNNVTVKRSGASVESAGRMSNEEPKVSENESLTPVEVIETAAVPCVNSSQEKNTEEVLSNQSKVSELEKNQISSEEQFLELRIDTPIACNTYIQIQTEESRQETLSDQGRNNKQKESNKIQNKDLENVINNIHLEKEHCEIATSKEILNIIGTKNSSKFNENIFDENINGKTLSHLESSNIGKKSVNSDDNLLMNVEEDIVINEKDSTQVDTLNKKNDKSSSSNLSLSLSDHSKLKIVTCDDNEVADMDLTTIPKRSEKVQKRKSEDNLDETDELMELTCESNLRKRMKKGCSKSISGIRISPGSIKSDASVKSNIKENSVSSSGTFYDAQSDGTTSESSNRWCLKSIGDAFENENIVSLSEIWKKLGLRSCNSYNLNLFSTFEVLGAIINIIPNISPENNKDVVKGFCNERCRKEYIYGEFSEMKEVDDFCTFCRHRYHLACPGCLKDGLSNPLCLYYSFEIHLLDGKNVLRIEVEHQSGLMFIGCTPQIYLKSNKLPMKIHKIIASTSPTEWTKTVLLKAKIKVMPKLGIPTLTLQGTSLKKDLMRNGKHYKL